MQFSGNQHQSTNFKKYKTITDRKLRDKLLKGKELDVPKVVEQIQQNTYERKNKKNTIPEALISSREKDIKEEPIFRITYTGQYGTRSHCEAPNWNPNHKCLSRDVICDKCKMIGHFAKVRRLEQLKRKEIKNLTDNAETEEGHTDRSLNIITEMAHITDRKKS